MRYLETRKNINILKLKEEKDEKKEDDKKFINNYFFPKVVLEYLKSLKNPRNEPGILDYTTLPNKDNNNNRNRKVEIRLNIDQEEGEKSFYQLDVDIIDKYSLGEENFLLTLRYFHSSYKAQKSIDALDTDKLLFGEILDDLFKKVDNNFLEMESN